MSNSAKTVLWLGFFMIVAGIVKNWSAFSSLLFSGEGQIYGASGSGVNISGGVPVNPSTGKCPQGYNYAYGKCWSPAENPVPSTSGGST